MPYSYSRPHYPLFSRTNEKATTRTTTKNPKEHIRALKLISPVTFKNHRPRETEAKLEIKSTHSDKVQFGVFPAALILLL